MNYRKMRKDNYTLHLINTDRFKKVDFSIKFTKNYVKEDIPYYKLLEKVLAFNGSKKYKTVQEISKKLEYLYNTSLGFSFYTTSKNMVFEVNMSIINPKYVKDFNISEALEVMNELLVNPLIKDEMFDEKVFDLEKDNLIKSIMNVKDNPEGYALLKFEELFFKNTVYSENNYKNIGMFKELNNKVLYKKYRELFNSFKIDAFVIGEINEEEIIEGLNIVLKDFKESDNFNKDLYININPKFIETKEEINTNQSNLIIGLTFNNLTEEEKDYKLVLFNTILGCMNNSVLFVNVRENHSLCYTIGSTINRFTSSIVISSGINKNNYSEALFLIKESLDSMTDKNTIKPLLTNAKKTLNISYNDFYDNAKKIINYYYINEFVSLPSIEERRNKILNMSEEDVIDIAKKSEVKTIFLLEGSINEED